MITKANGAPSNHQKHNPSRNERNENGSENKAEMTNENYQLLNPIPVRMQNLREKEIDTSDPNEAERSAGKRATKKRRERQMSHTRTQRSNTWDRGPGR